MISERTDAIYLQERMIDRTFCSKNPEIEYQIKGYHVPFASMLKALPHIRPSVFDVHTNITHLIPDIDDRNDQWMILRNIFSSILKWETFEPDTSVNPDIKPSEAFKQLTSGCGIDSTFVEVDDNHNSIEYPFVLPVDKCAMLVKSVLRMGIVPKRSISFRSINRNDERHKDKSRKEFSRDMESTIFLINCFTLNTLIEQKQVQLAIKVMGLSRVFNLKIIRLNARGYYVPLYGYNLPPALSALPRPEFLEYVVSPEYQEFCKNA